MPKLHKNSEPNLLLSRVILLIVADILVVNAAAFLALFIRFEFSYTVLWESQYLQTAMRWAIPNTLLALGLFAALLQRSDITEEDLKQISELVNRRA